MERIEIGIRITDDDLVPKRHGPGSDHLDGLGVALCVDEEDHVVVLADPFDQRHRLGGGRRLVKQRRIGDLESGEVADHGLEVQQGLEATLGDLRLIGRVGGVPARILEDVALDHAGVIVP